MAADASDAWSLSNFLGDVGGGAAAKDDGCEDATRDKRKKRRLKEEAATSDPDDDRPVHSPDSGFVDGASSPCTSAARPRAVLAELLLPPLLSPLHRFPSVQLGVDGAPSLKCRVNVSQLPDAARRRLRVRRSPDADSRRAKRKRTSHEGSPSVPAVSSALQANSPSTSGDATVNKFSPSTPDEPVDIKPFISKVPSALNNEQQTPNTCDQKIGCDQPVVLSTTLLESDENLKSADYCLNKKARPIKHLADREGDKLARILLYLESIVYFVMSIKALERQMPESSRPYAMVKDTYELLRQITQTFVGAADLPPTARPFVGRVHALSLRVQAVLTLKRYRSREPLISTNQRHIDELSRRPPSAGGDSGYATAASSTGGDKAREPQQPSTTPSPTPSPASSAGSGSMPPGHVAIPLPLEQLYRSQLHYLNSLRLAHRHWDDAERLLHTAAADRDFFEAVGAACGAQLTMHSPLLDLCRYVMTAVREMRRQARL